MENDISPQFRNLERRLKAVLLRLPVIAGNEAINFILDNYKRQGFLGDTFQPWKPRKNPNKWGQTPKRNGRAIRVDTGRERRAWRVVRVTQDMAVIGTDVPYAKALNDGVRLGIIQNVKTHQRNSYGVTKVGKGTYSIKTQKENMKSVKTISGSTTVKAHTRRINQNIPARPVYGKSTYFNNKLKRVITAELMKALK